MIGGGAGSCYTANVLNIGINTVLLILKNSP
ncbi:IS1-like element transposase [Aeromonas caviae]